MNKKNKKDFMSFEFSRDALVFVATNYPDISDKERLSALINLIIFDMCKIDGDIIIFDELGVLED